jgi:NADPH2:quinone reductase
MKAITVERPGGPDVLHFSEVPKPEPQAGQVLVKIAASGINYIDVYYRNGQYKAPHFPFTPGMEAAGVVDSVGPNVSEFKRGDHVAYAQSMGSYAEYAVVPAEKLVHVPDGVSLRDAAALMLQGMTAHYLVNSTFALGAGQTALIQAGAGGVGLLLTQLAKAKGATVISTVSTDAKAELSKGAGADHVIKYTERDFAAHTRELTGGKGVDVVYDSVGKTTFEKSLDVLRPRGLLALFGASSGPVPPFNLQELAAKGSLFVTRPTLANYIGTREDLEWRARDLFALVLAGKLKLRAEHEYPLSDATRAHSELEGRMTTGKLLLVPASN